MTAAGDGEGRWTFRPSARDHLPASVVTAAAGALFVVVAVVPFRGWDGQVGVRVFLAAFGGFLIWLGTRSPKRPAFEVRDDGIEYQDLISGEAVLLPRQSIGLVTVTTPYGRPPEVLVLDRTGEPILEYECPKRQRPALERACLELGYPWSAFSDAELRWSRLRAARRRELTPVPPPLAADAGDAAAPPAPPAGVVRFQQNRRSARIVQALMFAVYANAIAWALVLVGSPQAIAPGALVLLVSLGALSPKGPVAIEVRPEGITFVKRDATTDVVPRDRIGSISVGRWPRRLVVTDHAGQVIDSRIATHYNWMAVREALLAAGYPWHDPDLMSEEP